MRFYERRMDLVSSGDRGTTLKIASDRVINGHNDKFAPCPLYPITDIGRCIQVSIGLRFMSTRPSLNDFRFGMSVIRRADIETRLIESH